MHGVLTKIKALVMKYAVHRQKIGNLSADRSYMVVASSHSLKMCVLS